MADIKINTFDDASVDRMQRAVSTVLHQPRSFRGKGQDGALPPLPDGVWPCKVVPDGGSDGSYDVDTGVGTVADFTYSVFELNGRVIATNVSPQIQRMVGSIAPYSGGAIVVKFGTCFMLFCVDEHHVMSACPGKPPVPGWINPTPPSGSCGISTGGSGGGGVPAGAYGWGNYGLSNNGSLL